MQLYLQHKLNGTESILLPKRKSVTHHNCLHCYIKSDNIDSTWTCKKETDKKQINNIIVVRGFVEVSHPSKFDPFCKEMSTMSPPMFTPVLTLKEVVCVFTHMRSNNLSWNLINFVTLYYS